MSCGLHYLIFVRLFFRFSDLITDEMELAPNKGNALASLMDDAVVLILHCLPTHSLFYYKCVCRSWNHLIKDYNNHNVLP